MTESQIDSRRRKLLCVCFAISACIGLAPDSALGAPRIVAGASAISAAAPSNLPRGSHEIEIYLETGSTPSSVGEACADGDGDELCGLSAELRATGRFRIDSFTPNPTAGASFNLTSAYSLLVARGVSAGDLGSVHLGTLAITIEGTGSIQLGPDSRALGAALQSLQFEDTVIAVYEPSCRLSLVAGILLLFALSHRR